MKAQNKAGTWFMLKATSDSTYLVYKLCHNYAGHINGGIAKTWKCVQSKQRMSHREFQEMARNGMSKEEATTLFNKKLGGKQKP